MWCRLKCLAVRHVCHYLSDPAALALVFTNKIGVMSETIFAAMLNDRLVTLLSKAKVADRMLEFMPPSKRTNQDFAEHFKASHRAAAGPSCAGRYLVQVAVVGELVHQVDPLRRTTVNGAVYEPDG